MLCASLQDARSVCAARWQPSAATVFETCLRCLVRAATPTTADVRAREDVMMRLSGLVRSTVNNKFSGKSLEIQPYGSFLSGLYTPEGDLDLSIEGTALLRDGGGSGGGGNRSNNFTQRMPLEQLERTARVQLLFTLTRRLRDQKALDLQTVTHARVPIVKFVDFETGVECDVAVDSMAAQFKSAVLGLVAGMDWRAGALIRLVKVWAREHELNNSASGTFNSFALSLLVVFHLQRRSPAVLPPLSELFLAEGEDAEDVERRPMHSGSRPDLQKLRVVQHRINARVAAMAADENRNHETLTELLASFFCFFRGLMAAWCGTDNALSIVLRRVRIDTWQGALRLDAWEKDFLYCCSIEDPFDATDNCGRTVRDPRCIARIKTALDEAVDVCCTCLERVDGDGERGAYEALEALFSPRRLADAFLKDDQLADFSGRYPDPLSAVYSPAVWLPRNLQHVLRSGEMKRCLPVNHADRPAAHLELSEAVAAAVYGIGFLNPFWAAPCASLNGETPFACIGGSSSAGSKGDEESVDDAMVDVGFTTARDTRGIDKEEAVDISYWCGIQVEMQPIAALMEIEAEEREAAIAERKKKKAARSQAKNDKRMAQRAAELQKAADAAAFAAAAAATAAADGEDAGEGSLSSAPASVVAVVTATATSTATATATNTLSKSASNRKNGAPPSPPWPPSTRPSPPVLTFNRPNSSAAPAATFTGEDADVAVPSAAQVENRQQEEMKKKTRTKRGPRRRNNKDEGMSSIPFSV